MTISAKAERTEAVSELKRSLILAAARRVFESEGLDRASIRAIAREAGYTAGAIYFYFPSKEAIYGAILQELIGRLVESVERAVVDAKKPEQRFQLATLAFFDFFAEDPRDLDFGFYLFGGGMRPHGISREADAALNESLLRSLAPVSEAARQCGFDADEARACAASAFAHAVGLLLLKHTRRIRIFALEPRVLMEMYAQSVAIQFEGRCKTMAV
ncbi:MAG TPA: helix-turn-helix domain-containing protein [Aliidongia sp.]|uniref:TetR/AcrR family transcriptional regulator n=1 Tax=Aliidongia sp. TaxID=1914230 RepID=UPI002DDC97C3|nr:helix-turn-helix domain-containing protein [Aliidongia sp.]HEV2675658.1 helix-turn-helix domain-containing protein [Aliidongia sp.]